MVSFMVLNVFSGSRYGNDDRVLPLHFYNPGKLCMDIYIIKHILKHSDIHNIICILDRYIP